MSAILQIVTVLGVNGLFAAFFLWERRRTQVVVDRHLANQEKLYSDWLREQRDLYERYLEDLRDWTRPRDHSRFTYQPGQVHVPGASGGGGSEARPFATATREIAVIPPPSAGD